MPAVDSRSKVSSPAGSLNLGTFVGLLLMTRPALLAVAAATPLVAAAVSYFTGYGMWSLLSSFNSYMTGIDTVAEIPPPPFTFSRTQQTNHHPLFS